MAAGQSLPHFSLHVASFTKATKADRLEVEETTQVVLTLQIILWPCSLASKLIKVIQVSLPDPSVNYLVSVCWANATSLVLRLVERRQDPHHHHVIFITTKFMIMMIMVMIMIMMIIQLNQADQLYNPLMPLPKF